MIGSMEVPISEIKGLIVIKNWAQSTILEVKQSAAISKDKAKSSKLESKYFQLACFRLDQDTMM